MALGCWGMLEGKVEGMLGRMLGLGWGGMLGLGWGGGCWDWDEEGDAGTGMQEVLGPASWVLPALPARRCLPGPQS